MKTFLKKLISFSLVIVFVFSAFVSPTAAQGPTTSFANCHFGIGSTEASAVGYNLEQLNMGLYSDWWVRNPPPAGLAASIEYVRIVRVHQDKEGSDWYGPGDYVDPSSYSVGPNLNTITNTAILHPGALWLIGNEIDRRDWNNGDGTWGGQDEIMPELYATAFHEIRALIKSVDPTARIGVGGVVQATPLRLKYLDRIWDSYYTQYGYSMGNDVDVWTIHTFILREVHNSWGAEVPAGLAQNFDFEPEEGLLYNADIPALLEAHKDITYFKEFTQNFRHWMATHGESHKPLLNTEYGILYRDLVGLEVPTSSVTKYLTDSFDYMLDTTDEEIGYPAGGNRLVQGWIWYSLQDEYWNGNLFNPTTKTLSPIGTAWKSYVSNPAHPLASQPQQNLIVSNLKTENSDTKKPYYIEPTSPVSFTLRANVSNGGNSSTETGGSVIVSFWEGLPDNPGNQIGSDLILSDLPGCGWATPVEMIWPDRFDEEENNWHVRVEPIVGELNEDDNVASDTGYIFKTAPQASLFIDKSVDNGLPVEYVDPVNYTIKVTNTGPDTAYGVEVDDPLPEGLVFMGYKATQGNYFSSGPWFLGNLAANTTAILTITAKVEIGQAGNDIVNIADISHSDSINKNSANKRATVTITPRQLNQIYIPLILK